MGPDLEANYVGQPIAAAMIAGRRDHRGREFNRQFAHGLTYKRVFLRLTGAGRPI
jgi:hypothetical protein